MCAQRYLAPCGFFHIVVSVYDAADRTESDAGMNEQLFVEFILNYWVCFDGTPVWVRSGRISWLPLVIRTLSHTTHADWPELELLVSISVVLPVAKVLSVNMQKCPVQCCALAFNRMSSSAVCGVWGTLALLTTSGGVRERVFYSSLHLILGFDGQSLLCLATMYHSLLVPLGRHVHGRQCNGYLQFTVCWVVLVTSKRENDAQALRADVWNVLRILTAMLVKGMRDVDAIGCMCWYDVGLVDN